MQGIRMRRSGCVGDQLPLAPPTAAPPTVLPNADSCHPPITPACSTSPTTRRSTATRATRAGTTGTGTATRPASRTTLARRQTAAWRTRAASLPRRRMCMCRRTRPLRRLPTASLLPLPPAEADTMADQAPPPAGHGAAPCTRGTPRAPRPIPSLFPRLVSCIDASQSLPLGPALRRCQHPSGLYMRRALHPCAGAARRIRPPHVDTCAAHTCPTLATPFPLLAPIPRARVRVCVLPAPFSFYSFRRRRGRRAHRPPPCMPLRRSTLPTLPSAIEDQHGRPCFVEVPP